MENIQQNEKKKTDRRVIKTKRAICNAFAKLLSTKSIEEITVTDIADEADVNRKTVYNYYKGIHEILDQIENEIVSTYEKLIMDNDFRMGLKDPCKLFKSLTEVLSGNVDFYGHLLKSNVNSQLLMKIVSSLKGRLKEDFLMQKMFPEDKVDLVVSYVVSGMISAYQTWFNSGMKQPIEEFSKDVSVLVLSGISPLIRDTP